MVVSGVGCGYMEEFFPSMEAFTRGAHEGAVCFLDTVVGRLGFTIQSADFLNGFTIQYRAWYLCLDVASSKLAATLFQ